MFLFVLMGLFVIGMPFKMYVSNQPIGEQTTLSRMVVLCMDGVETFLATYLAIGSGGVTKVIFAAFAVLALSELIGDVKRYRAEGEAR